MRRYFFVICFFCLGMPTSLLSQTQLTHNPWRPFLQSRQGTQGRADFIDHKRVSTGAHLICYVVEAHGDEEERACVLKFGNGSKSTLKFEGTTQVSKDDEVSLECLGSKPTRCQVGIWFDTPNNQPQ